MIKKLRRRINFDVNSSGFLFRTTYLMLHPILVAGQEAREASTTQGSAVFQEMRRRREIEEEEIRIAERKARRLKELKVRMPFEIDTLRICAKTTRAVEVSGKACCSAAASAWCSSPCCMSRNFGLAPLTCFNFGCSPSIVPLLARLLDGLNSTYGISRWYACFS